MHPSNNNFNKAVIFGSNLVFSEHQLEAIRYKDFEILYEFNLILNAHFYKIFSQQLEKV